MLFKSTSRPILKKSFTAIRPILSAIKTPEFILAELSNLNNQRSPLSRIQKVEGQRAAATIEDELKLVGNIFRSALRQKVLEILSAPEVSRARIEKLCSAVKHFREVFWKVKDEFFNQSSDEDLHSQFHYIDEYLSYYN